MLLICALCRYYGAQKYTLKFFLSIQFIVELSGSSHVSRYFIHVKYWFIIHCIYITVLRLFEYSILQPSALTMQATGAADIHHTLWSLDIIYLHVININANFLTIIPTSHINCDMPTVVIWLKLPIGLNCLDWLVVVHHLIIQLTSIILRRNNQVKSSHSLHLMVLPSAFSMHPYALPFSIMEHSRRFIKTWA